MSRGAAPSLLELQRWLARTILEPERVDTDIVESTAMLAALDEEQAKTRLRAYTNGYPARLREALSEAFPALEHVVGRQSFADAVLRYRGLVPTGGYSLTDVGGNFATFLKADALGEDYPFAADLAELEWAVLRAFHAREREPFDPSKLQSWSLEDWQRALLVFQPSVAVVDSAWPIIDIWDARDTDVEQIDIELVGRPQIALVRREGFKIACDRIDVAAARALEQLLGGATLGEATEALAEAGGEGESVAASFAGWMQARLIADCTLRLSA